MDNSPASKEKRVEDQTCVLNNARDKIPESELNIYGKDLDRLYKLIYGNDLEYSEMEVNHFYGIIIKTYGDAKLRDEDIFVDD